MQAKNLRTELRQYLEGEEWCQEVIDSIGSNVKMTSLKFLEFYLENHQAYIQNLEQQDFRENDFFRLFSMLGGTIENT